jgi:hypothetical protein
MGLLDDAIREHLDLKRRRGADPTEVEREEREVLGPVRRRGEPAGHDELAYEPDLEHEPLPLDSEPWDEEASEPRRPAAAFDHEQIAPIEPERYPGSAHEPERYAPPAPPEPFPAAQAPPDPVPYRADVGHEPPPEEATAEFSVEHAIEEEDRHHGHGAEEEDVLEETPDFLQDTPDHDRLWFEQRPPRDFDFDG